jgi:hypothetical protein
MGWVVNVTPRPYFTSGKDRVSIVEEAGWAPRPVWTGAENLAPPPGFDPRTVQPLASRCTDCATRPFMLAHKDTNIIYCCCAIDGINCIIVRVVTQWGVFVL